MLSIKVKLSKLSFNICGGFHIVFKSEVCLGVLWCAVCRGVLRCAEVCRSVPRCAEVCYIYGYLQLSYAEPLSKQNINSNILSCFKLLVKTAHSLAL